MVKRKISCKSQDVRLAEFYVLQAEIALAQTKRANRTLLISIITSVVMTVVLSYTHAGWGLWPWSIVSGILVAYRVISWIWPEKHDNLNVLARKVELEQAKLEVQRMYGDGERERGLSVL